MTQTSKSLRSRRSFALCAAVSLVAFVALPSLAAQSKMSDTQLDAIAKTAGFSKQTVLKGMHNAILWPWLTKSSGLSYLFAFNGTANYTVAAEDQGDYNKLPGMGDCGSLDIARNGAMFGWRWNKTTNTLQISPYANAFGVHQYKESHPTQVAMVELEMADIQSYAPLRYDIQIDGAKYLFTISGTLPSGRIINAKSTLPRGCDAGATRLKNGSHFYFGGTRTAPVNTSGYMKWISK